ncbi:hypothetical protein SUGI_1057280 [Cryptomeria japonica]|uniref:sister chromatid cohesion protein PDS5 homolog C-like n=1 Tax=Cryptomeria japonica TaxID=3369 RepID=UPI0024148109|nr:sister chromatid cohesion protein PDS5 homolog C-like [Cryptomeria japonica]GLJ49787.1 hypothetical protein SUGI_1057280 [Cryptomeria japonica]
MASSIEIDLGEKIYRARKKLEHKSQQKEVLLSTLEEVEAFLCKVGQDPSQTMQLAIAPLVCSLIKPRLMRHRDEVIKLATISCIGEIMRIAAPNDPYDSHIMKEVLQMMAESFEGLDDIKNPYFSKRVKLLEIFAKFRFENIMIAMDCVDIIRKMFHIFWRVVDEVHPNSMITSMQSIIFSVLYGGDDAISKLMSNDLWVVWNGEKDVSPMAHELLRRLVEQHKDRDTSPMICRNLYDNFVRHVVITQEDMRTALGNELSTSSLQEVTLETSTLEASIEHINDMSSNGMDSLDDHIASSPSHDEKSDYGSQGQLEQRPLI